MSFQCKGFKYGTVLNKKEFGCLLYVMVASDQVANLANSVRLYDTQWYTIYIRCGVMFSGFIQFYETMLLAKDFVLY